MHLAALALLGAATLAAQAPSFSIVSSVKPAASLDEGIGGTGLQGDTYRITNAALVYILREAFDLPPVRITGGPDWMRRDRFRLDAAVERRERPIYTRRLVSEGKLGPMLARSSFDCRRGRTVDAAGIAHQAELRASG